MIFLGHNKRSPMRWTVTAADPGERFAFDVQAWGLRKPWLRLPIVTWEYRFEPIEGGTRVTETWTDARRSWPDAVLNAFDTVATGGHTFAEFNRRNIETSLRRLRQAVEEPAVSS